MSNSYVFFRFDDKDIFLKEKTDDVLAPYTLEIFSPTLRSLKRHKSSRIIYLFWFFITRGRYKVLYLRDKNAIIHYTHIFPKFFKLPFMSSKDLMIGPAWTIESYRGKGVFPALITYIVNNFKKSGRSFHIFAHADNVASQKAIEKAEFYKWATGYKTKKLGIYKVEKT